MKSSHMTIGDVAARFGLATHVLRHWESIGLLDPQRAEAGRRRYGRADLYRVAVILRAKEAGFALEDIRAMLTTPDAAERNAILRRHRDELARRIAELRTSLELIDCALACDHEDVVECPNFQAAITERVTIGAAH